MLLVAAALTLTLLSDGTPAHAQGAGAGSAERVLLSNLGEATSSGTTALSSNDAEIRFVTATYEPGYIITRVDLKFTGPANSDADLPFVALRNHIGTEITLTGSPTDLGGNTYAFTPDSTARVASNSGYFLLIEGGTMSLAQTLSNTVDTGSGHRWLTVPTDGYTRAHDSTGDTSALTGGAQFLFSIRGRVIQPTVPYVANTGQTNTGNLSLLSDDRAQPFTTGSDAAGYTLHSVTVLMRDSDAAVFRNRPLHPLPDLAIHRGSANGPKVAEPRTPPSGWSQEYVLDTPVTLDPSTAYWVVAAGGRGEWDGTGTAEDSGNAAGWSIGDNHEFRTTGNTRAFTQNSSTGALKVGINGPPVNSPATGKPAVTAQTFRVPAVLSVDLSGITDTDGIADAARAVTAYRWQRFAAAGVTRQRANIGTDATYTLTDADIGKTIKVAVSFEDDSGFSEGPLTSDATTAAWVCPEPDLQGGATRIEGRRQIGVAAYRVGGADRLGYRDILHRQHGTLNDNTFTTTATTSAYTIEAIEKTSTAVWFNLDKDLADADKQALALHVCGEHYALSDFTLSGGGHEYFIASSQD